MSTKALGAGLAALATTAALAATGSAQSGPTTLHLVDHQQSSLGFFPAHRPRTGDRVGFAAKVTGDDTGTVTGVCTVMRAQLLCNVEVRLTKGSLSAQGIVPQRSDHNPIAITGGTGAYAGASGVAIVTDTSATRSTVDVTLGG
jgi:hypothetical protein